MSIKLMSLVWDSDKFKNKGEKFVLLALADYANDDGYCWPSVPRIAKRTLVSDRQAIRILQSLEAKGIVSIVERGNGRGQPSIYRINAATLTEKKDDISDILTKKKGDISDKKGDISRVKRVTFQTGALYIDPSIDPSTDPSARARKIAPDISNLSEKTENCKPKQHVRAVRQGEETITFSTPIPLEQQPSPPVAPAPSSLPPAFEPVAPIVAEDFTAAKRPEQSDAQKVFGEYFPGKALSAHQWKLIAEAVTDIPKWIRVCQRWSEVYTDWRKFGLLDWYRNGIPDEQGGRNNERHTRATTGNSGKVSAEELYPEYAAYQ